MLHRVKIEGRSFQSCWYEEIVHQVILKEMSLILFLNTAHTFTYGFSTFKKFNKTLFKENNKKLKTHVSIHSN